MLNNIPTELKAFRQFICWKLEERDSSKPTKIPYCPQTGYLASVTNPKHWDSFDGAIKSYSNGGYDGIGFVLTDNDPFTFIDLDKTVDPIEVERQMNIFKHFDSYSEISPSGQGLHIIIKGKIPCGRRRSSVEIYSNERYMTMTGNVYHNVAVKDQQNLISILWEEMGKGSKYIQYDGNEEQKYTDEQIIDMALSAKNGERFRVLNDGEWKFSYHSQSEADFAFIDIIAFYTQNKEQIRRIFLNSNLGKRDKAKRPDYFGHMIGRAFDRLLPPIDLEAIKIEVDNMKLKEAVNKIEDEKEVSKSVPLSELTLPPGLMGDLANYIYSSSYRPVPEISLAAAIGLMAGICGRQYNISEQGLNLYILMLAKTGRGKEAMATKVSELMNYICAALPAAKDFIGPGDYASGQGLVRYMSDSTTKSCLSIAGEFGLKMQQISNPMANSSMNALKSSLLDLYHKSGKNSVFRPVAYSDKERTTKQINSPAFTILGESTPASLYDGLDEGNIVNGLLPRFLTIEYLGPRVNPNERHAEIKPPERLLRHLHAITNKVLMLGGANTVIDVRYSIEADIMQRDFERYCTSKINDKNTSDAVAELWNRSHIKAIRLAALIAVGCDENFPIVQADAMKWAIDFVQRDTDRVVWRFDKGKIGKSDDNNQNVMVMNCVKEYLMKPFDKCGGKYDKSSHAKLLHENKLVTYQYLSRRLLSQGIFKLDRLGATNALKKTIQTMMDAGALVEVPKIQLQKNFGSTGRAFVVTDSSLLEE